MAPIPDNSDDVIDSRDLIERIEDLAAREAPTWAQTGDAKTEWSAEYEGFNLTVVALSPDRFAASVDGEVCATTGTLTDAMDLAMKAAGFDDEVALDAEEAEELAALRALAAEVEMYANDWTYGATLIRDSYFVEYCQDLVSDTGDLPRDIPPYLVIDWNATAENLRVDYTSVEFGGVTYWVR